MMTKNTETETLLLAAEVKGPALPHLGNEDNEEKTMTIVPS